VAARAAASVRSGGAGRSQRRPGKRLAWALEGTWRGEEWHGATGTRETAGEGGGVTGAGRAGEGARG
jgi:hypothetical protein